MIQVIDLKKDQIFYKGTRLRKYNVGLNTENKAEDYYDYILAYAHWNRDEMMLVNITEGLGEYKAGSVYGGVLQGGPSVNKEHFMFTLEDIENWYILDDFE